VLIRADRVGFLVDAAIFGFAVGPGFAVREQLFHLHQVPDAGLGTLVVPGFGAILLPDDWQDALRYLPSNAGAAFTSISDSASHLTAGAGVLVFAGWVLAFAAAAAVTLRRRDV